MKPITRRDFGRLALAAVTPSRFGGVTLGVQCYSFRDRPLDAAIQAMTDIGISACEMNYRHLEPAALAKQRDRLREWRLAAPLADFVAAAGKVRDAGIDPWAYTFNIRTDFTEAEMIRGFEMSKALGATGISCSANLSMVPRIDALARKYKIRAGLHNHSRIAPDEIATPDDLLGARKRASDYLAILLDIGHFVAAGFDPLDFVRKHHADIIAIHVKDRKRAQGPNVPLGEGDTPVKEVLRLIRDNKYPIRADIEYEYEGQDTVAEVRRCFEYCKRALLG
jgi:sugar phosphate isomerase/epimerase